MAWLKFNFAALTTHKGIQHQQLCLPCLNEFKELPVQQPFQNFEPIRWNLHWATLGIWKTDTHPCVPRLVNESGPPSLPKWRGTPPPVAHDCGRLDHPVSTLGVGTLSWQTKIIFVIFLKLVCAREGLNCQPWPEIRSWPFFLLLLPLLCRGNNKSLLHPFKTPFLKEDLGRSRWVSVVWFPCLTQEHSLQGIDDFLQKGQGQRCPKLLRECVPTSFEKRTFCFFCSLWCWCTLLDGKFFEQCCCIFARFFCIEPRIKFCILSEFLANWLYFQEKNVPWRSLLIFLSVASAKLCHNWRKLSDIYCCYCRPGSVRHDCAC